MSDFEENNFILPFEMDVQGIEQIQREAKYYETLFSGKQGRKWTGFFVNVLKKTPSEIIRYAAVATLFYSYFPMPDGSTMRAPGAWFAVTCRRYQQLDAMIPANVRAWSETGRTLEDLAMIFQKGIGHPAPDQFLPS